MATTAKERLTAMNGFHSLSDQTLDLVPYKERPSLAGFVHQVYKVSLAQHPGYSDYEPRTILNKVYKTEWTTQKGSIIKAAMGETSGSIGGYTVPQDYTERLLGTIEEESFIFPRADIVPMQSAITHAPTVNTTTAQTAGTPPYFGGLLFKWGASSVPTETEPTFRQVQLNAWDLIGYGIMSNQFLNDITPEAEKYLYRTLGRGAAWMAEYAFLQGLGADESMPLGVIKSPCFKAASRAGANAIAAGDLSEMASFLLPYSWKNAIWACHPTCLEQIVKLSTYQVNTGLVHARDAVGTLLTRPLFVTDKLPALGTVGDIILFDPSLYVVGVRQEVLIDVTTHGQGFRNNQSDFRVWLRMDGRPRVPDVITIADGTTTVSPFVGLAA